MKSLGLIDDLSAVKDMIGVTNTHEPNEANFAAYRALLPIWIRLTRKLGSEYQAIADYQRAHPDPAARNQAQD